MVNKTDSDYRTISVRLPRQEFIEFDKLCKDTHSAKLRELINKEIKSNSKSNFLSGINKITYNKVNNSFSVPGFQPSKTIKLTNASGKYPLLW